MGLARHRWRLSARDGSYRTTFLAGSTTVETRVARAVAQEMCTPVLEQRLLDAAGARQTWAKFPFGSSPMVERSATRPFVHNNRTSAGATCRFSWCQKCL